MLVELEPLQEKHAATSFKWRNNPDLWKFTFNRPDKEVSLEMELEWIRKVTQNKNEKRFAILADKQYVGNIYLTNIENNSSYFGIFLGDVNTQGKGIAQQAMQELFEMAKNQYGVKEIFLRVKTENVAAQKLYQKLNFKVVETFPDYYLMKNHI